MGRNPQFKPQDILLALKLVDAKVPPQQAVLAKELGISPAEVSFSLSRLRRAHLLRRDVALPLKENLFEFLVHGLKYILPVEAGPIRRGIPTAHSAPPLSSKIKSNPEDQYVWPHDEGTIRGQSISPIYPTAPDAARQDKKLYQLLSLLDAIRVGRAREQKLAVEALRKIISDSQAHA